MAKKFPSSWGSKASMMTPRDTKADHAMADGYNLTAWTKVKLRSY